MHNEVTAFTNTTLHAVRSTFQNVINRNATLKNVISQFLKIHRPHEHTSRDVLPTSDTLRDTTHAQIVPPHSAQPA